MVIWCNNNWNISLCFADKLPWYYTLNWLLQSVATTSAFEISIFYAIVIAPGRTLERNLQPITFHLHVVNSILFLIDVFLVANPTRILHFVYTVCYGLLYTIFLLILHFTDYNSAVYPALNFRDSPRTTAMWLSLAVLVLPIILYILIFFIYQLRLHIAKNTVLKNQSPQNERGNDNVEMGKVNSGYD